MTPPTLPTSSARIYKFSTLPHDPTTIHIPNNIDVLHVNVQNHEIFAWALIETNGNADVKPTVVRIFGTGQELNGEFHYINTFMVEGGKFVFHAFVESSLRRPTT